MAGNVCYPTIIYECHRAMPTTGVVLFMVLRWQPKAVVLSQIRFPATRYANAGTHPLAINADPSCSMFLAPSAATLKNIPLTLKARAGAIRG